jgi:hypothetical protein
MYPWELEQFIRERDYYLGGDDLAKATSPKENPQLNHIKYDAWSNRYEMWDAEGNYYSFAAMPYTEAIEKGLVKKLVKKKENKIENVKQT